MELREKDERNEARELGRNLQVFKLYGHKNLLGELISMSALESALHQASARESHFYYFPK